MEDGAGPRALAAAERAALARRRGPPSTRTLIEIALKQASACQRGGTVPTALVIDTPALDEEDVEDLDEAPDNEVEAAEEQILDQATAARTINELKAEIETLKQLEGLALAVWRSGTDRKWCELANLLSKIFTAMTVARYRRRRSRGR
jgi:hypothetical protein